jgi:hypothetical protein
MPLYQKTGLPGRTVEKGVYKQRFTARPTAASGLHNCCPENAQCDLFYLGRFRWPHPQIKSGIHELEMANFKNWLSQLLRQQHLRFLCISTTCLFG